MLRAPKSSSFKRYFVKTVDFPDFFSEPLYKDALNQTWTWKNSKCEMAFKTKIMCKCEFIDSSYLRMSTDKLLELFHFC